MGVLTTLRKAVRDARRDWDDLNQVIARTPQAINEIGRGGGGGGRLPRDRQSGAALFAFPAGTVLSPSGAVVTTGTGPSGGVRTTSDAPALGVDATSFVRSIDRLGPVYSVEFLRSFGTPGVFQVPGGPTLSGWYVSGSFYPAPQGGAAATVSGTGSGGGGGGGGGRGRGVRNPFAPPQALDRNRAYTGAGGNVIRPGDSDGGGSGRATAAATVQAVQRLNRDLGSKLDRVATAIERGGGGLGDLLRRQT